LNHFKNFCLKIKYKKKPNQTNKPKTKLKNQKKGGGEAKINTPNIIFIIRAGMGEVSILSICDLCTLLKTMGLSPNITSFD
jgi:hypothetical protein